MQPETSVFQVDSVGCAVSSSRSQCWGKEAHTKVEEKSRSEKIHMEKSPGCMVQDRLNCVFPKMGGGLVGWIFGPLQVSVAPVAFPALQEALLPALGGMDLF